MAKAALITVTYNSERHIEGFVASLNAQRFTDFVLIVVDNASQDGTVKRLEQELASASFDHVIIQTGANLGVAAANNRGIEAARHRGVTDWAVIVNNDVTFGPDLLERLLADPPGECILSPLILDGSSDKIWFAGGRFDRRRMMSTVHDLLGTSVHQLGDRLTGRQPTEYAPTTCLAVPIRAFDPDLVGSFYEPFFCYYDDADWAFRANRAGFRFIVDGDAVLRHFEGGASGGNRSAFSLYYLTRNRLLFVDRSLGRATAAMSALALLAFVLVSGFREQKSGHYLRHRLRGWFAGVSHILGAPRGR